MTDFLELTNRYRLDCTLHSDAAMHISTGVASEATDSPFIRMGDRPFLPGSSLRGAMRSHLERLLKTLRPSEAHILFEKCSKEVCVVGDKDERTKYERSTGDEYDKLGEPKLCPVCRLFGSTLMAARLKIGDATLVEGCRDHALVKRDGVGIDRDTDTAKEHIKYDFEVLESGADFTCSLQLENAEQQDFALLYILLMELRRGIDVGGKKTRGLGRVRLTKFTVSYFDQCWNHKLADYLEHGLASVDASEFEIRLHEFYKEWACVVG